MNSPAKSSEGNKLVQELNVHIGKNLTNEAFGVEELATAMGYSRSHLHRKLQKHLDKTISQYIREYRLEKASSILKKEDLNVSEVAYMVGFGSATYFSKSFTAYFGIPPSEIKKQALSANEEAPFFSGAAGKKSKLGRNILLSIMTVFILGTSFIFMWRWLPGEGLKNKEANLSIALMPLTNLSNDPLNLYLVQGVGDAIARKLSALEDLRVVSQLSTSHLYAENKSLIQIADKLKTSYVLEGSIQKINDQVRIEVGLVNGKTGIRIWSEHYDRGFDDIFNIENEIAEHVATSLKSHLSPIEISDLNKSYTDNAKAYELYLKGVFELRTYTRTGINQALDYFMEAIQLDSTFAMAYNWLGHSIIARAAMFGAELDALEALELAIVPIEISLEIDPDLSEARAIRAFYYLYHDWDFKRAEKEYQLGINKREPEGYALYADYLNFVRRHQEALTLSRQQEKDEPYYPNTRMILSLYYTGQVEEALSYAEARFRILKNYSTMDSYGFVLLNSGDYQRAIEIFKQIFEIENIRYPRILGWLGAAYARSGQETKAEAILKELKEKQAISSAGSTAFFIAVVNAALGNTDEALHWLRIAIDDHEMEIPWLISEPQFYALHEHPEFKRMVREVGFPEL